MITRCDVGPLDSASLPRREMARSGDGLATAELRRVETMTGGLLGKPHDWRPLSPCFVVGCWGRPSVMWLPRGHRAPFQWGGIVLSPATAGQRDAVRCEIGCVTPTHRRPEIPACQCSPITIEQSRTTSSHRLGRLALWPSDDGLPRCYQDSHLHTRASVVCGVLQWSKWLVGVCHEAERERGWKLGSDV